MSSPAKTPSRRSRRGQADDPGTPDSTVSRASTRSTRSGRNTPSTPGRQAPSTPGRTATPGRKAAAQETPKTTPSRRSKRAADKDDAGVKSPPSQRRRVDASPGLAPMPSSPPSSAPVNPQSEAALFSSPAPPRGLGTSEIDLSSPLNYGTPSSRLGVGTPRTPGAAGTPIRPRPDVRSDRKMRTVNIGAGGGGSEPDPARLGSDVTSDNNAGPQLVIWGTDVVVDQCKSKFRRFVQTFIDPNIAQDEKFAGVNPEEPLYLQRLDEINMIGEPFLNFNCDHLKQFDADLYRQLVNYPQEVIPILDMALNELFFSKFADTNLEHQIQVRPFNADLTRNMRELNPEDIDKLITITGMVIRLSNLIPEMREAFFQCSVCRNTTTSEIERGRITEPTLCQNCNTNHSFQLIHNRSQFTDKQLVKIQESPEDMPAGQTPHTVIVFAHGDMVDKVTAGDNITITGIYRAQPMRPNPKMRSVKSVYKTHIDVVHYRKRDQKRLQEVGDDDTVEGLKISEERLEDIKKLAKEPDVYGRLAAALAPSIYENEDIKKGILLQLFGGAKKDLQETGRGHFRAELNILLCGDPGTSKSQLLKYVHSLVPRGQYTSGKGSTAVGLTAYITKDIETKQLVLQTGALVLSDNGVCCIDEFDKMNESTRSVLHEVMEQQTLSIAKAGIICSLNARTSILAAANPIESQWNKNKTIIENIQLPHTLMSRFDLIFLMLDPQNELFDRKLATHLVSMYYHKTDEETKQDELDMESVRDYLQYAKTAIHPRIGDEASQALIEEYVEMRKMGSGRGQVSAYPRQLESLIRLAEAHAKMRLSNVVEKSDVQEARRLQREALKQVAVDPATGKIDFSIVMTGMSGESRKLRAERAQALKTLIKEKGKITLKFDQLFESFRDRSDARVTRDMFDEAIKDLQDDGEIIRTGAHIRLCT